MDRDEALSVLKMLVETNTTNPPGNEQRLAEKIKGLLDGSAAESYIVTCGEDRASLVSRIVGTGKEPPWILCGGHSRPISSRRREISCTVAERAI